MKLAWRRNLILTEKRIIQDKYTKLYPDVNKHPNKYENWWVDGDWDFTIPVEKNNAQTETIEIQAVDSDGNGVTSLTKTPFEITMNTWMN